jgi:hypothetical protein
MGAFLWQLRPILRKAQHARRSIFHRQRHWAHPQLKKFGTIQDHYYWVAENGIDTLLPLQNYFSAFYPKLDTKTDGTVCIYDKDGGVLGSKTFSLVHWGSAKFRVSSLLAELGVEPDHAYGTLEVHIRIPEDVLADIKDQKAFYFWDRFPIAYVNSRGEVSFVHGLGTTNIHPNGQDDWLPWQKEPAGAVWAPETPIDIEDYAKFNVIMINRASRAAEASLVLSDINDDSLTWKADIPSRGVRRFELTKESTAGLYPKELRMRVHGLSSKYGRPVVVKEFANGAISAMHT